MVLLTSLKKGTQTIANLRSLLTLKTAELNELVAQLELANQAIFNVESTTTQIESMLKDLGLSGERNESVLMHAEATLDSAIKTASSLYDQPAKKQRRPSMAASDSSERRMVSLLLLLCNRSIKAPTLFLVGTLHHAHTIQTGHKAHFAPAQRSAARLGARFCQVLRGDRNHG